MPSVALRLIVLLGMLCPGQVALAVTEAKLLGPDLRSQPVRITTLENGTLGYFDEDRNLQNTPISQLVQLRIHPEVNTDAAEAQTRIELTDGQRFIGQWIGATPDGSSIRWQSDTVGELTIPLDQVRRIILQPVRNTDADASSQDSPTDTMTLNNGDTLAGFVSKVSDQGVDLIPEGATEAVTIPLARITKLSLANPPHDRAASYHLLSLVDGTRMLAENLAIDRDQVRFKSVLPGGSSTPVQAPLSDVARINFAATGYRLVALTDLPMHAVPKTDLFGLPAPVNIRRGDIHTRAPADLTFDLPDGAVRFAAAAELDTADVPRQRQGWADFTLILRVDKQAAEQVHVTADQPTAPINLPLDGRVLSIHLEPGLNGPILDRVILKDPVVLIQQPTTGADSGPLE